jgi:hypothetical protein
MLQSAPPLARWRTHLLNMRVDPSSKAVGSLRGDRVVLWSWEVTSHINVRVCVWGTRSETRLKS